MPKQERSPFAALHLLFAGVIAVTALLPEWITITATGGGRMIHVNAGLWGTPQARWDDMRVDFDIFGPAYLALVASLVATVMLLRAAVGGQLARRVLAKKVLIVALVTQCLFMARMLIETGVVPSWAGIVGPLAVIAALFTLREPAKKS
jgi:hypothetical protein